MRKDLFIIIIITINYYYYGFCFGFFVLFCLFVCLVSGLIDFWGFVCLFVWLGFFGFLDLYFQSEVVGWRMTENGRS